MIKQYVNSYIHIFLSAYHVSGVLLDAGTDSLMKEIDLLFEVSKKL